MLGRSGHRDIAVHRSFDALAVRLRVDEDDPWGYGRSLEWATSCPPPRHNFTTLPGIRSESPAFDPHDLHHPEISALRETETAVGAM